MALAAAAAGPALWSGTKWTIGMIAAWLASMEGRAWRRSVSLEPRRMKTESDLQMKMMEAEQEGTARATKESKESYNKHLAMLMQMNRESMDRSREQRLLEMKQGSMDNQAALMMQVMSSLSQTPQISAPPTSGRMSLLRGGF